MVASNIKTYWTGTLTDLIQAMQMKKGVKKKKILDHYDCKHKPNISIKLITHHSGVGPRETNGFASIRNANEV